MSSSIGRDAVKDDDDSPAAGPGGYATDRTSASTPASTAGCGLTDRAGRPRWKVLLIGLLLIVSLVLTVLFVAALAGAVLAHHWAQALDDSRDAVPAAVGWSALLIVLLAGGRNPARQMLADDSHAARERERRAARDADSVRRAEQRVDKLTARLLALSASTPPPASGVAPGEVPGWPGPGASRHAGLQAAITRARLDQAEQWLAGARAALAVSERELAEARDQQAGDARDQASGAGPTAGRMA